MGLRSTGRAAMAVAIVLVTALGGTVSWAQVPAAGDPELRALGRQMIQNPNDRELAFRYAEMAAARGEPDRAMATYERILIEDPTNLRALDGVERLRLRLEPNRTVVIGKTGYERSTNGRRSSENQQPNDMFFGSIGATDERTLGGLRWRTNGNIYGNLNDRAHGTNLKYIGANTGPFFYAGDGVTLRPGIGLAYANLGDHKLYDEVSALGSLYTVRTGFLKEVNGRVAYEDYSSLYPGRDGWLFEIAPLFAWSDLHSGNDTFSAEPVIRYARNQPVHGVVVGIPGDVDEGTYSAVGVTLVYVTPVADYFRGLKMPWGLKAPDFSADFKFEHRSYRARDFSLTSATQSDARRDYYYSPGISLIFPEFLGIADALTLRYLFEHNISNETDKQYQNHSFGVNLTWRLY
jgi:hypothetical protein